MTTPATESRLPPRWHDSALDVLAAALLPIVLFLATYHDVVSRNSEDLLYSPSLTWAFLTSALVAWTMGALLIRRFRSGTVARLWLSAPWAVLLLDVTGAALEDRMGLAVAALADLALVCTVVVTALTFPWRPLRAVAAAAGVSLLLHGAWSHADFVRQLPRGRVIGAGTSLAVRPPPAGAPGNVYHILLDTYQSEAFTVSVGSEAPRRFPGFTFYSRFNTNFPRTQSAEVALLDGRFPRAGMSIREWPVRALARGFWADLAEGGAGLWLYPYDDSLCHTEAVRCVTSGDVERDARGTVSRDTTLDLWALRLMPASLRRALRVDEAAEGASEFSLTRAARGLLAADTSPPEAAIPSLPRQYFNLQQFERVLADEDERPPRGQYVYYHALIPHWAPILDAQCQARPEPYGVNEYWGFVACANLMIERLVDRLRELERLEDALIIVHADHGDPMFVIDPGLWMRGEVSLVLDAHAREYQVVDDTYSDPAALDELQNGDSTAWQSFAVEVFSSGLLLVKWPGASTYSVDDRPVQLVDIGPTVLAHFGRTPSEYDGVPLAQVEGQRQPVFYAHSRYYPDGKFSKYVLTPDGWRFVEAIEVSD